VSDDAANTHDVEDEREATEDEACAVRRACLEAAYAVINNVEIDENLTENMVLDATLRAMRAADDALNARPREAPYVEVDAVHVAASAWWKWVASQFTEFDDDEVDGHAVGGMVFLGFASAAKLLEACADVGLAASDDDWITSAYVDEALAARARTARS